MGRKTKTLKFTFLEKGEVNDYQTILEEVIGPEIASLSCYNDNSDGQLKVEGKYIEKDRAYFVPDCDYEIIIRPKK